ncbi:MAG: hypothetical protein WBM07_06245 [Chitinivibrionales bacterium]
MCCLLAFSFSEAQSLLSLRYPFGLPVQPNSGMSLSMGGAGVGLAADYNIMLLNPANLGSIEKTVFSALYTFDVVRISQSSEHTNFFTGVPRQVSFGIPLGKYGTLGASFEEQSDADARFQPAGETIIFGLADTVSFQPGLKSSGGIVSWQLGWGREFEKLGRVKLGVAYERVYFLHAQSDVFTINSTNAYVNSRDSIDVRFSGNGLRLGVMAPLGKLNLGLSGEYFFTATAQGDNAVFSMNDSGIVTGTSRNAAVRIAPSAALGAAYSFSSQWSAAADLSGVFWNYYKSGGLLDTTDRKNAALSFSAGGQFIPAPNLLTPKYWETINYRAGFRYSQLPLKTSSEFAVMLGTGLPIGRGSGMFDVGLEIGRRIDGGYSGYSENFMNVIMGFNGGQKWNKSGMGNY